MLLVFWFALSFKINFHYSTVTSVQALATTVAEAILGARSYQEKMEIDESNWEQVPEIWRKQVLYVD